MIKLSDVISTTNCMHCVMDKCKNHKKSEVLKRFTTYINRPEVIPEVKERIAQSQIHFGEVSRVERKILSNGFMFATCVFCHIKKGVPCKNRREGRYQEVLCGDGSGKRFSYCYPDLGEVKHRIQIGLHLDVEINERGQVQAIFENDSVLSSPQPTSQPIIPVSASVPVLVPVPVLIPTQEETASPIHLDTGKIEAFLEKYRVPRDMQNLVRENILLRMQNMYLQNKMCEKGEMHEIVGGFYEKMVYPV